MTFSRRFVKLMMMTTSSHDAEALTAMRMANAELASINKNWEEVLNGISSQNDTTAFNDKDVINELFKQAFANTNSESFTEFLTNVESWWKTKGFLTPKQFHAVKNAAGRK